MGQGAGVRPEEAFEDDDEVRRLYLEHWLGEQEVRRRAAGDRTTPTPGAPRCASGCASKGYDPDEMLVFEDATLTGRASASRTTQRAIDACLRLWLEDHGRQGRATGVGEKLRERGRGTSLASRRARCRSWASSVLYDGKTGEPFDQPVTVGVIHDDEAAPPGGRQSACPLDRPVLPGHPAAAGRQGAVRRPALRRDGSVGAGSLRRGPHPAGDADGQVGRRAGPRQDLRGDRQGRADRGAGHPGLVPGAGQGAAKPGPGGRSHQRRRARSSVRQGRGARSAAAAGAGSA